ncbi:UNVERIFIED_CONTAM: Phospholipase D zeta 1 [Sesamum calycinum]|uniref:Phospholipase n=1 Tax=Sesamum calycinum TaxID=2727403 RepID=A0AAW2R9V2_9LAMI
MGGRAKYVQMQPEARPRGSPSTRSTYFSFHQQNFLEAECTRIFDELPEATIVQISRPDAADISPMMLTYTIEFQYKETRRKVFLRAFFAELAVRIKIQVYGCSFVTSIKECERCRKFKWQLMKQASQVFYLHFALKKRKFIEEIHEKQEQVREWLQNLGIGDHAPVMPDDEEPDDEAVPSRNDEIAKNSIQCQTEQEELCKILESLPQQYRYREFRRGVQVFGSFQVIFSPEYGPKLKEDYIMVKHLPKILGNDDDERCCSCQWVSCCRDNWQKVWAVLKPGFLAFLKHPFDLKPLDIVVFDVLPASDGNGEGRVFLAKEVNDHNPLRHYFRQPVSSGSLISFLTLEFTALAASTEAQVFGGLMLGLLAYALPSTYSEIIPCLFPKLQKVTCGTRSIKLRTKSNAKVKDWVAAINDAGLRPPEGWCHSHRFGSFAPPRGLTADGSQAQWFVDGRAAFKAIALAIEEAKSEIFICGWWLCPELYLQRPFHAQASSRLDSLLESKAKQGVQVYILLYKEVALALKINSVHSKRKLLSIHENIRVLRYPDHFSTGVYLWSHHEKIVIVDHQICFIGGLDLCFGRYDYGEHKVGDHPAQIWPGKDYYNPRESEPNSWEDMMKDELDRKRYPRMPWHDVQCALWGPPCSDLARHFVQRWNYAKRNKAPNEQAIPLLLPQHHMVIPHYLGMNKEIEFGHMNNGSHTDIKRNDSFSSRASSQDIPLLMPQEAGGLDDVEGGTKLNGSNTLHDDDHPSRRYRNPFYFHKSRIEPLVPEMPLRDFADDLGTSDHQSEFSSNVMQLGMQFSEKDWWETQERGNQVLTADETGQVGPRVSCSCQNQFFISGLSGDELIHNRVLEALYRRIMRAHNEKKCFRVIIVIPLLPGFQGGVDDSGAASVRAIALQYRTICRGHNSILHNLYDLVGPRVHDYISFYGLRAYGRLFDGGPVATSQIGVLIEDKEYVNSLMGGSYWRAGKFASSLRISLWSEHLGLHAGEVNQIRDPVIDSTYKDIWMATAKTNTMIYQDVFSCIPNDLIHTRAALRQGMSFWREKVGQTTIDLGIAPKKLETYVNGDVKDTDPMERLECVKGHLVSYPLEFMCKEDLRPVFNESEYYASPQVFH